MNYECLLQQAAALLKGETHPLPCLSNLSALLYTQLPDLNWAGFYLMEGGSLLLGPFQGKPACIRIAVGRGVCGTAAAEDAVQRVENVHLFPGHIACDSASNAEIVVPIHAHGRVLGVLDLDSPTVGRFTARDQQFLQGLVVLLENHCDWSRWQLSAKA